VFHGVSEYLEDLVARIDAPLLGCIQITFFNQLIFDIPQLALFMRRTTKFEAFDTALMHFSFDGAQVGSYLPTQTSPESSWLRISTNKLDCQLLSLAQVFTFFFPSIDMVKELCVCGLRNLPSQWEDDDEIMLWVEIFQKCTAVKGLTVFRDFSLSIALALQELVGEIVIEVLPALETVFFHDLPVQQSGLVKEAIGRFVDARELSGHPVASSHCRK
jgi:hypothetical protein